MIEGFRTFVSRVRLDVLSSPADWAFVMAEADALQSEDPNGCIETARARARNRDGWRYEMVVAELIRRRGARWAHSTSRRPHRPGQDASAPPH